MEDDYKIWIRKIVGELERARRIQKPMYSHHEAYSVILGELDEYWDSVKSNRADDPDKNELVQVAVMAIMALCDL